MLRCVVEGDLKGVSVCSLGALRRAEELERAGVVVEWFAEDMLGRECCKS